MTTNEFKKQHPEHAHLEGNELWNAMENALLKQQIGAWIVRSAGGFFTRYKLRKLWYYQLFKIPMFVQPRESNTRCSACKRGVSYRMVFIDFSKEVQDPSPCPYCRKPYIPEPNTNLSYKFLKLMDRVKKGIVRFLNWTCIIGSNPEGRYGMFGDEQSYVKSRHFTVEWKWTHNVYFPRKWFEWIFVRR